MSHSDMSGVSQTDIERYFSEQLKKYEANQTAERNALRARVSEEALLWLALAPGWTKDLAEAVGFPAAGEGVGWTFEELAREGVLDKYEPPRLRSVVRPAYFVMTRSERSQALGEYRDHSDKLRERLVDIGQRIEDQQKKGLTVPSVVGKWAWLAARSDDSQALARRLDKRMSKAYQDQDAGEIHHWIETARPLANLLAAHLENDLSLAVRRAALRLELLSRIRHDVRRLKYFLKRPEQIDAVRNLIDGPDDLWGLHFIGAGGVGKTMLVRYITTPSSDKKSQDWQAHTARIDFDYINPNYPRQDPGLLLWSLAQELRAYDPGTRATDRFDKADRIFRELHQKLSAGTDRTGRGTDHPLFRKGLRYYLDALRALPERVLLIVDTCEELAKAGPWSTAQENISETFRILRALHDGPASLDDSTAPPTGGVPSLRVIFAGRRPLASMGEWSAAGQDYVWRCPTSQLDPQNFLRLHEVRGFDFKDARKYLEKVGIKKDLIEPIRRKSSPDAGSVVPIEWLDTNRAPIETDRCNPYDLRFFLDWAQEDPPPAAAEIEHANSNQYVEFRILRRLRDETLAAILPALALLKYFDRDLLCIMAAQDDTAFDSLYEQLKDQEWIERQLVAVPDQEENRLIFYIEEGLRLRLLEYYGSHDGVYEAFRKRAADYYEQKTLDQNTELDQLEKFDFDAALRALEAEPGRALRWWQAVEERIFNERLGTNTRWILNLTDFLAGEEGRAGRFVADRGARAQPESRLRPAVLTTQAAALLHVRGIYPEQDLWWEVSEKLSSAPIPGAESLSLRALAGLIGSTQRSLKMDTEHIAAFGDRLGKLAAWPDCETVSAVVAALEALVELAEVEADHPFKLSALLSPCSAWQERLLAWMPDQDDLPAPYPDEKKQAAPQQEYGELVVFSYVLIGRANALRRDSETAQAWLFKALNHPSFSATHRPRRRPWAYWIRPADFTARVRLEAVRCLYPAIWSAEKVMQIPQISPIRDGDGTDWEFRIETSAGSADSIDHDRLQAVLMRLALNIGDIAKLPDVSSWLGNDGLPQILRQSACNAHRKVPPAFIVAAEIAAAQGGIDGALSYLRRVPQQTESYPLELMRRTERVLVQIIIRQRLGDEGESAGRSLQDSPQPADKALFRTLGALNGLKNEVVSTRYGDPPGSPQLHADWQSQYALAPAWAKRRLDWALRELSPRLESLSDSGLSEADFADVSVVLDAVEALYINSRFSLDADLYPLNFAAGLIDLFERDAWWQRNPDRPIEAMILRLRCLALIPGAAAAMLGRESAAFDAASTKVPGVLAQSGSGSGPSEVPASNYFAELVGRVGLRRAAELALGEGDLLSLRCPAQATVLYQYALDSYRALEDIPSMFIAGTALASTITQINEGERRKAPVELKAILAEILGEDGLYQHLLDFSGTAGLSLPTVQDLLGLPASGSVELLNTVARVWRPWIVRLAGTLVSDARARRRDTVMRFARAMGRKWSWLVRLLARAAGIRATENKAGELQQVLDNLQRRWPWVFGLIARRLGIEAEPPQVEQTANAFRRWLLEHYSATVDNRVALPASFAHLIDDEWSAPDAEIADREPKAEPATMVPEDSVKSDEVASPKDADKPEATTREMPISETKSRGPSIVEPILYGVLGLAILSGTFGGGFLAYRKLLIFLAPDISSAFTGWPAYVAALVVFALAASLYGKWFSLWNRQSGADVNLKGGDGASASGYTEERAVRMTVQLKRPRISLKWPFVTHSSQTFEPVTFRVQDFRSYHDGAKALQCAPVKALALVLAGKRSRPYQIDLIPDKGLQGIAWEALFALALGDGKIPLAHFEFRRSASTVHARRIAEGPQPARPAAIGLRSCVNQPQEQEVARRGWQPLASSAKVDLIISDGREEGLAPEISKEAKPMDSDLQRDNTAVRILHLLGSVEETNAGLRYRFAGDPRAQTHESAVGKTSWMAAGTDLPRSLASEDLVSIFPGLEVCIIQDRLQETPSARGESDRIQAAMARTFAAELFELGTPVVMFVPALGSQVAVEVLEEVAAMLKRRPKHGLAALLKTVSSLRQKILEGTKTAGSHTDADQAPSDAPGETSREAALDVCLFCKINWDGRQVFR